MDKQNISFVQMLSMGIWINLIEKLVQNSQSFSSLFRWGWLLGGVVDNWRRRSSNRIKISFIHINDKRRRKSLRLLWQRFIKNLIFKSCYAEKIFIKILSSNDSWSRESAFWEIGSFSVFVQRSIFLGDLGLRIFSEKSVI